MSRILFMGTPEFAVPSLKSLIKHHTVVGVLTQPDKPKGRGLKLTPSPVKATALEHHIPVFEFTRLKSAETTEALQQLRPDIAVVVAYGRILPANLLTLPRLGCINVHASLLPRHRGASPIAHALLEGDTEAGVSIMQLDEGLDTGPVYSTQAMVIPQEATCGDLTVLLADLGAALLEKTLPKILCQEIQASPQNAALATYAPLLQKSDGQLDFSQAAETLVHKIKAFSPWPSAFVKLGEQTLQILNAHPIPSISDSPPGTVCALNKEGIFVVCGQNTLCITVVKPQGKGAMPAAAFVAGRGVSLGYRFI